MRTQTRAALAIAAAAAVAAAGSGCTKVAGVEAKPPKPVKALVVAAGAPTGTIRYSATIEPFEQVTLSFKTSGYVVDLLRRKGPDGRSRAAQAGDRVGKGTILARVNDADYRERVNQGQAKLAESDASLKKARLDLDRAKTLFASDSLTKPELDAAQASFDASDARVTAARADLQLATSALQDCQLATPSGGVLLERKIEVGSLVSAGSVGFVMGDVSTVKARFGIPDTMIAAVTLGDPIGVIVEATAGTTYAGRVTAIAPAADPQSRVFDVEVTIPNREGHLRPGMIGTVAVNGAALAANAAPVVTVPLAAIVKAEGGDGRFAVLVVEKQGDHEVARVRHVELGDVIGNGITVRSGVAAGDRVVVSGASLLVDGESVRVM